MNNYNEDDYKRIFSKNLNRIMDLNNKSQIDLINDLGFNKSAVSTWCNGTRLPRMDKVDLLCNYFKVKRSDLLEESKAESRINSIDEHEIINSYRVLSGNDKALMSDFLTQFSSLSEHDKSRLRRLMAYMIQMQKVEHELMAAHNDHATDDEELEKIKKDFDKF